MNEPSKTVKEFAPHAAFSEVGVAVPPWTPDILTAEELSIPQLQSKYVTTIDESLDPKKKGERKVGGILSPLDVRGSDTRVRRPLKVNLPNEMEYKRKRELKTLGEKLDELNKLREEIALEKMKQQEVQLQLKSTGDIRKIAVSNNNGDGYPGGLSMSSSAPVLALLPQLNRNASVASISSSGSGPNPNPTPSSGPSAAVTSKRNALKEYTPKRRNSSRSQSEVTFKLTAEVTSPTTATSPEADKAFELREENDNIKITSVTIPQKEKLTDLEKGEMEVKSKYIHFQMEQERIDRLKLQERTFLNREKSRNIERRRRLLTEEEGRRRGPPPEDPPNIYDYYAVRIQSTIRGFIARAWTHWYRRVSPFAILKIQVRKNNEQKMFLVFNITLFCS